MKVKTSELTGAALDWAVAKCEGHEIESLLGGAVWYWLKCSLTGALEVVEVFKPSTDWAQGGPIMEREKLSFCYNGFDADATPPEKAYIGFIWNWRQHEDFAFGGTPLIAAMRCYVFSKLGEEVDAPQELA